MELTPTIVDAVIGVVVLISAILAYGRGLTREVFTLGVWLLAALAALQFYPMVEPIVEDLETAAGIGLGSFRPWAAVLVTFVLSLIVLSVIGSAISSMIRNSVLGSIDKGLGFLFGALRGLLLLAVVWMLFDKASPATLATEAVAGSRGAGIVKDTATALSEAMPAELPEFLKTAMSDLFGDAPGAVEGGEATETGAEAPATSN